MSTEPTPEDGRPPAWAAVLAVAAAALSLTMIYAPGAF